MSTLRAKSGMRQQPATSRCSLDWCMLSLRCGWPRMGQRRSTRWMALTEREDPQGEEALMRAMNEDHEALQAEKTRRAAV